MTDGSVAETTQHLLNTKLDVSSPIAGIVTAEMTG
jgi:hypothetical protein